MRGTSLTGAVLVASILVLTPSRVSAQQFGIEGVVDRASLALLEPEGIESLSRRTASPAADSIAKSINREIGRQGTFHRSNAFNQAQQPPSKRRSWIGRHPALFGALVGVGAGAVVGVALEPKDTETPGVSTILGAGIGAGVGAIVGAVIGARD